MTEPGTFKDILDFSQELSERFGDMNDADIILAAEEYAQRVFDDKECEAIICAYDHGTTTAYFTCQLWGIKV